MLWIASHCTPHTTLPPHPSPPQFSQENTTPPPFPPPQSLLSLSPTNPLENPTALPPVLPVSAVPTLTNPSKPPLLTPTPPFPKPSSNPFKNLVNSTNSPPKSPPQSQNLTNKRWLPSKLCPPPPPPLPLLEGENAQDTENEIFDMGKNLGSGELPRNEFRQEGKIFVGNLPLWIKKNEVSEFFWQFGPIKNVILIKDHDDYESNMGFGFVIYGGSTAAKSAMKTVEFDGVKFHGRVWTVKLDDGRRRKAKSEERARWVEWEDGGEFRSKWHEEREGFRREYKRVLETQPENW